MNEVQRARLVDLLGLMKNFPNKHRFNMDKWIAGGGTHGKDISCGTTCCAAGWGVALLPSWQEVLSFSFGGIVSGEYSGYEALAVSLGIQYEDAVSIFDPYEYDRPFLMSQIQPLHVAERILAVIAKYEVKHEPQ